MPKIFTTIDKFRPIYNVTEKVIMVLCKLLLIADILITSMAVCGRYVSFIPDPAWTEQVVLTLMAYMAVLSASLAIRKRSHIRMTAFDRKLPKKVILSLDFLADLAVMALAIIMLTVGWQQAQNLGRFGKYESLPWLSRFWKYFPVPLAGIAMIIFELEAIYNDIKAFFTKGEKTDDKEDQVQ
ncbi:MAG: TRAP transporter small permease [Eubacteriales bacterium]|nr:TRAP transporter small permease [Eubacteriales bacterium]